MTTEEINLLLKTGEMDPEYKNGIECTLALLPENRREVVEVMVKTIFIHGMNKGIKATINLLEKI